MQPHGIHHLTAVTADAPGNVDFYTRVLGMRMVKKTVNQDDVSAYHLFYGDGVASPGTDLTFFDFPAAPERHGTHSITRTGLRVAGADILAWWQQRFADLGIEHGDIGERDGRATLDFVDPEGQRFALIEDEGDTPAHPWDHSPVPAGQQIRGLGPITLSVPRLDGTDDVLRGLLGLAAVREYAGEDGCPVHVYRMAGDGPHAELHVAIQPHLPMTRPGAGGVHHVALRIPDADYAAWCDHLHGIRLPASGPVDRFYFRSLYMREPNGILIELATDGPGFTIDEPLATLGEQLSLPPFLEHRRAEIEARIKPL